MEQLARLKDLPVSHVQNLKDMNFLPFHQSKFAIQINLNLCLERQIYFAYLSKTNAKHDNSQSLHSQKYS